MEWLPTAAFGLALALIVLLGCLIVAAWRRRRWRGQVLREDALKQLCSAKEEGRSLTTTELGGRLGLSASAALRLVQDLEGAGLLQSCAGVLELTTTGRSLGLHVLRGHRLWERYLADEAQVPLDRLHGLAERAEHRLVEPELNALADHLGHPRSDPHGDPIPGGSGEVRPQERVPLTDWPLERVGVVVHIEDEPPRALNQALGAGLRPGTVLRVIARGAATIAYETAAGRFALPPAIAAHIHLRTASDDESLGSPATTLVELPLGEQGEVLALAPDCKGLRRRRLLDLGFTPGTHVEAVLASPGGSARAYRVRGTLFALRQEQATQVLIRPSAPPVAQGEERRA
jgi:DtxR family Mn-dependent transcriptional regulator